MHVLKINGIKFQVSNIKGSNINKNALYLAAGQIQDFLKN